MDISKIEVAAVEQAVCDQAEQQVRELASLELSLVGGGLGDVSLG